MQLGLGTPNYSSDDDANIRALEKLKQQFLKAPFPCSHKESNDSRCIIFHDDMKTGLCPKHRQSAAQSGGGGLCGRCTPSPAEMARRKKQNNMIGVAGITVVMGIIESNDKFVLAVTGCAFTVIAACNIYVGLHPSSTGVAWSIGLAWVVAGGLVLAVAVVGRSGKKLTKSIDAMEVTSTR